MPYSYTDPKRASDPHALPDVEIFKGYEHECRECEASQPLFPDYYGLLYPAEEACRECGHKGLRCTDTLVKWYYAFGQPSCLWDGDPSGPYASEAEALAAAREYAGFDDDEDD